MPTAISAAERLEAQARPAAGAGLFRPEAPKDLDAAGLSDVLVDSLLCKYLLLQHSASGRSLASALGLPCSIVEKRLAALKQKRFVASTSVSTLGDFTYQLAEEGQQQTLRWMEASRYIGPAPVPLEQYVAAIKAQSIRHTSLSSHEVETRFGAISVQQALLRRLGPAIRSGSGLFLYGSAGNGKTTLAEKIGLCFQHETWIPHALVVDGNIIKLFDPAYHHPAQMPQTSRLRTVLRDEPHDERWVRIRRATVVAGGELTLESLEIRHDPLLNVSEAPLQMKANCGVLVIDDFGRQRVQPVDLLNRWIVPLDRKYDLLTLFTGKKIQVPFELLVIFSTNLEPESLVDEAFLRRIPYKIFVPDPEEDEYCRIFSEVAASLGFADNPIILDQFLQRCYRSCGRAMRRCHPRDLLLQLAAYCDYHDLPRELHIDYLQQVANDYFIRGPLMSIET